MGSNGEGFGGRFWALIGATFLGFLGMGTVLPALGPHIRYDLGGSDQTVGLVIGVFSFVALGARLVSGPLADRRGRKIAFLTGLTSCALAGVAYLLPVGIAGAYIGRMFQGLGEACLYTGAAIWIVETGGLDRGSQALGYMSSGIWGGISAGPVVGQWLGTFNRAAEMQVLLAVIALVIVTRVPEHYRRPVHTEAHTWNLRWLLKPGLAVGFVNVHYPVIAGFLILHLARHGNSGRMAFSAYALLMLVSRFFLGGLPDRMAPAITYYSGLALMSLGLIVLASGPPPALAVSAAAVLGFGFSFPWSSILATVLRRTASGDRGSTVGVLSAFYDLFVGMSAFAAGGVSGWLGYWAAFVMAVVALGGAAFMGRFVFAEKNVREEAAAVSAAGSPSLQ
ncbi:MAG TPA: MFS transporter [Bryobacteraceae bacterium]|nr:MFS transporter [Bryobacteraceae bacterium]